MSSLVPRIAAAALVVAGAALVSLSPGSTPLGWHLLDASVGLALGLAAILAPAPLVPRLLLGATSLAWSAASVLPVIPWHQGLVLGALLTLLPSRGARPGPARVLALAGAAVVGVGLGGQALAALVAFAAAVAVVVEDARSQHLSPRTWYATVAALALAAVWGGAWAGQRWWPDGFDPMLSFAVYACVLLALAIGFLLVAVNERLSHGRRLAQALEAYDPATPQPSRLLEAALGEALGDDRLVLVVGPDGVPEPGRGEERLVVSDPTTGRTRAGLVTRSTVLRDDEVRRRVLDLLELVATDAELTERRRERVRELEAARRRLLRVADEERGRALELLGSDVIPRVQAAMERVDRLRAPPPALVAVRDDLRRMEATLDRLVAGHPPAGLGDGALPDVVREVAARAPLPVTVLVQGDPRGTTEAETALFYVCCEGLANVVRHAAARHAAITVAGGLDDLILQVEDDGRGGAEPEGRGLLGLADRLASVGGELRVTPRPGGGTSLLARISRPSSRVPR